MNEVIKKILMGDSDYWILQKKNYVRNFMREERLKDQVILVSFPREIPRALTYEEITLKQMDLFSDIRLDCNIFLNEDYAPFQLETRFYDIIDAHPVSKCREFLIKALNLGNETDFYNYVKLEKEISEPPKDLNETKK